jgi:NAD(P)-dependent dehydrogenase (short-subunit alcohol dehydrogenase family)
MKLEGKVALVTGAGRGIGRAHALRLAQLGADVVINDINLEAFKEFGETITAASVVEEVKALGVQSTGVEADVGKKEQVEAMVKRVLEEFGHIDILINNAGGLAGEIVASFASSVSEEDLTATFDRNLMGTIFCGQAVAEPMKA